MYRLLLALVCGAALSACVGDVSVLPADDAPLPDGGASDVRLSSWTDASAGLPGPVAAMAHFDAVSYAVAGAGATFSLFSRSERDAEWAAVALPGFAGDETVVAVARVDLAVYATVASRARNAGALYRLELGKDGWTRAAELPGPASALVKKSGALLVAIEGDSGVGGLYASSDRGATWAKRASAREAPFFALPVRALVAAPSAQRVFAIGSGRGGPARLFQSDDEGARWAEAGLPGEVRGLAAAGEIALVDLSIGGVLRSDNYGNTWHPVAFDGEARALLLAEGRAFAATPTGVRVSADSGERWIDASVGLPAGVDLKDLHLAGGTLYASGASQTFRAQVE